MQKQDSKRFLDTWNLWSEFDAATHFATRCKIADKISGKMGDEDEKNFYEVFHNIIANTDNRCVQIEFHGFAARAMNGSFHIFFVDEDSIPIDYAFNVAFDDVPDTFTSLLNRYDSKKNSINTNMDGIVFHRRF